MKNRSAVWCFVLVILSYVILLGDTIYSYASVEGDLPRDLPKMVLWVPAVCSLFLPATYGALVFGVKDNSKPRLTLFLGVFMAVTLLSLAVVVHLVAA